ncbi:MAG TPA: class I SAM-dependent methyltransferase [Opitutaceae bacterium]|nr:class I SAM-dependent methyltransferase [Opitutaceae bacterium]
MANDNKSAHAAAEYDAEVRRVIPYYDAIHAEALDVVRAVGGEPECWVETGAGTGALAATALTRFPRSRFAIADPSEAMLAQARLRLAEGVAAGRVTILPPVASDRLPGIEPRLRAQAVTAVMCHHYLEPEARRAAVRGCFEILEPGGVLVVFENVESESVRGRELGLRRWREFQLRQGRAAEVVDRHLARFGTELKPLRIAEHLALLREVGFGTAELFWRAHMQAGFLAVK